MNTAPQNPAHILDQYIRQAACEHGWELLPEYDEKIATMARYCDELVDGLESGDAPPKAIPDGQLWTDTSTSPWTVRRYDAETGQWHDA